MSAKGLFRFRHQPSFHPQYNHTTHTNNTMKETSKKTTTKPAVKVKDIAPKKDAKGGKHTGPAHAMGADAMKHGGPGAAK